MRKVAKKEEIIRMPNNQRNTSLGTIAIAALVGGATGAFVSLLFAPKSGKAFRQDIQNKTVDIIEQVEDTTFQRAEAIKQRSIDLADKGKKLKTDIQVFIQDLKLRKPDYINVSQSTPEEASSQPETATIAPEFGPTEIPTSDSEPTI